VSPLGDCIMWGSGHASSGSGGTKKGRQGQYSIVYGAEVDWLGGGVGGGEGGDSGWGLGTENGEFDGSSGNGSGGGSKKRRRGGHQQQQEHQQKQQIQQTYTPPSTLPFNLPPSASNTSTATLSATPYTSLYPLPHLNATLFLSASANGCTSIHIWDNSSGALLISASDDLQSESDNGNGTNNSNNNAGNSVGLCCRKTLLGGDGRGVWSSCLLPPGTGPGAGGGCRAWGLAVGSGGGGVRVFDLVGLLDLRGSSVVQVSSD